MEQNSQLTAEQSLRLINETLNKSRKAILKSSGDYFILWGCLLSLFALAVFFLWKGTGSPVWNLLWFAMPVIGYPLAWLLNRSKEKVPDNFVSSTLGKIWSVFGAFSILLSICSICWVPMNITLIIILIFFLAEAISGVILDNWILTLASIATGITGAVAAVKLAADHHQILLFVIAGVILALTGVVVKITRK